MFKARMLQPDDSPQQTSVAFMDKQDSSLTKWACEAKDHDYQWSHVFFCEPVLPALLPLLIWCSRFLSVNAFEMDPRQAA